MQKSLDINLGIEGLKGFEQPLKKFNALSKQGAALSSQFSQELRDIGNNKKSIRYYNDLKDKVKKLGTQKILAKSKVEILRREIAATDKPTKKLTKSYEAAKRNLDRLTASQKTAFTEAKKRKKSLKSERIDVRNLAAEQKRLGDAYESTTAKAKRLEQVQAKVAKRTQNLDHTMSRAADAALITGGISRTGHGMLNAINSPLQSAMTFDDAMSDVGKFVKNANLETLSKQIRELGGSSPIGSAGVANLVAAGGKINLNAQDSLKFAKISEKQSIAYGISVDEAARTITKIRTSMNLGIDDIANLGDAINYVGDNSGSDAIKINQIVSRAGSIAKSAGLNNAETAAFAGAIDAGAANPEMAATSMRNILTSLTLGDSASNNQKNVLQSLGFNPQSVAADMQVSATNTIEQVLQSIADAKASDRNALISVLFGRESQASVANLVGNMDEYRRVMGLVANQSKYAGSTQKEYDYDLQKASQQFRLSQQQLNNVKIQLGTSMLPVLISLGKAIIPVVQGVSAFIEKHPGLTRGLMLATAGIAVAAIAIAPLVTGLYALGIAAAWASKRTATAAAAQAMGGLGGFGGKGGKGGKFTKFGKGAGVGGAIIGGLSLLSIATDDSLKTGEKVSQGAKTVTSIGGAMALGKGGAMAGATIGTMIFPGVGTAIGGALGGLIGSILGFSGGSKIADALFSKDDTDPSEQLAKRSRRSSRRGRPKPTIEDNSTVQIHIEADKDPEKTAELVIKKLNHQQRRRRRGGSKLYDQTGAAPA